MILDWWHGILIEAAVRRCCTVNAITACTGCGVYTRLTLYFQFKREPICAFMSSNQDSLSKATFFPPISIVQCWRAHDKLSQQCPYFLRCVNSNVCTCTGLLPYDWLIICFHSADKVYLKKRPTSNQQWLQQWVQWVQPWWRDTLLPHFCVQLEQSI